MFLTTIKLLLEKVTGNYICNLLFTPFDGLKKKQASYVSAANQEDCDHVLVQGPTTFHNATKKKNAKTYRELLTKYFHEHGSVPCQNYTV